MRSSGPLARELAASQSPRGVMGRMVAPSWEQCELPGFSPNRCSFPDVDLSHLVDQNVSPLACNYLLNTKSFGTNEKELLLEDGVNRKQGRAGRLRAVVGAPWPESPGGTQSAEERTDPANAPGEAGTHLGELPELVGVQ